LLSIAGVLAIWQCLVALGVLDVLVASSPLRIAQAAAGLTHDPQFLRDLQTSFFEFIVGFTAALVLGIALGVPIGWYRRLRYAVQPAAAAAYAAPRVALLPLLVLWFGFGPRTTMIIVFLGAFFVLLISVMLAVSSVDESLIRVARSYLADDAHVLRWVVLPAILPSVITGVRLAIAPALAGVVYGEIYAASSGLGYYIHVTGSTLQFDKMFVALVLLACIGLLLNVLLSRVERRLAKWRREITPT
jgi:NitT/TauT family transport system permease protein